jgi:beta-glucosidase
MKYRVEQILVLLLSCFLSINQTFVFAQQKTATNTRETEIERKIDLLLGQMTLAEAWPIAQLDGEADGRYRPEHLELARKGLLGSTLNVRGARMSNELQKAALESRLKIPLLFGFDVIHGYRTLFPVPLGETASWDLSAVEQAAAIAAAEARSAGVHWTFARWLILRATRVGAEYGGRG